MSGEQFDLGSGFSYEFFSWESGDPEIQTPEYLKSVEGVAAVEKAGVIIYFNGNNEGSCWFDTPETRAIPGEKTTWQLVSLDPLHIEPSIQMYRFDFETKQHIPSHHGWIRDGRWVTA